MTTTDAFGGDALIACDNLVRIYQVENIEVQALQGLDLLVDKGEMIAIVGQSGSGKSTLLNVLSGLDVPTAGAARVADWDLLRMSHADRLTYRRSVVGFVWQQTARNLLPYLSAKENVMMPMAFSGKGSRARARRASELLDAMGMGSKAHRRPHQLSGGEQQRVSIAVALANGPQVVFADEPTGELDSATGDDVFEALRSANQDLGATVVVVTHDHAVSSQVQRTIAIRDGRTSTEVVRRTHMGADGVLETLHEEYAVLDRAGRLQLPREYRDALELRDRVRLELEDDHVGVWNDQVPRKPRSVPAVPPEVSSAVSQADEPTVGAMWREATGEGASSGHDAGPAPTDPYGPPVEAYEPPTAPAVEPPHGHTPTHREFQPMPEPDVRGHSPFAPPLVETPSKPQVPTRRSGADTSSAPAPDPAALTSSGEAPPPRERDLPHMPWLPQGEPHD